MLIEKWVCNNKIYINNTDQNFGGGSGVATIASLKRRNSKFTRSEKTFGAGEGVVVRRSTKRDQENLSFSVAFPFPSPFGQNNFRAGNFSRKSVKRGRGSVTGSCG